MGTFAAPPARARVLLAGLALADMKIDSLALFRLGWGAEANPRSGAVVQVAVHRLRAWLAHATDNLVTVISEGGGYALRYASGAMSDAHKFQQLVDEARSCPAEAPERVQLLEQALALWRGPLLGDVPSDRLDVAVVERLLQQRRWAEADCAEALLAQGAARRALDILEPAARRQPLDEWVLALLVEALCVTGQQAAALTAYDTVRRRLRDELGIDPGDRLRAAYLRLLRRSASASEPTAASGADRPVRTMTPVPAQLPPAARRFSGREPQLRMLNGLLEESIPETAIALITGMAGVGKTALAVRWAHRVRDRFPDGQLFLNLGGHSAVGPMSAADGLARCLRALGTSADQVPADQEEAAAVYRSLLADRRVLVVLDDARQVGQVRPLLPAGPGSLVIVTSRERLLGLIAHDGARTVELSPLAPDEGRALLIDALGAERVEAERTAVDALIRTCSGLPLALGIVAANLSAWSGSIAEYHAELTERRLTALEVVGDERQAVRRALDASFDALPPRAQRLFVLLGQEAKPVVTIESAAALLGRSPRAARRLIRRLASAHLLQERRPDAYTMHDVLRYYAQEQVARVDGHRAGGPAYA
ncbi:MULTISPECIES: AfsR/SARP family transcriptional regulator [unclassified Nonomuraea]|uniref:AfsR/SARP family transcriptional regulator n=1 Tax=unclassified Nonomuraea TaxID=2593643 RepID=UPI001377A85F|nr:MULTISPECIES: BTAD domain-containing putative transcriptional regulator [unclassified Nonomuraea]NBF00424.1 hypothetical protein [Nonomuraea sp. K271]